MPLPVLPTLLLKALYGVPGYEMQSKSQLPTLVFGRFGFSEVFGRGSLVVIRSQPPEPITTANS